MNVIERRMLRKRIQGGGVYRGNRVLVLPHVSSVKDDGAGHLKHDSVSGSDPALEERRVEQGEHVLRNEPNWRGWLVRLGGRMLSIGAIRFWEKESQRGGNVFFWERNGDEVLCLCPLSVIKRPLMF